MFYVNQVWFFFYLNDDQNWFLVNSFIKLMSDNENIEFDGKVEKYIH